MPFNAPLPTRKPEALLLPTGFRASAWRDLDPHGRFILFNEVLAANPGLTVTGGVNFESSFEPLLNDSTGRQISLSGEVINDGAGPLHVAITEGTIARPDNRLWIFGLIALAGIVLLTR